MNLNQLAESDLETTLEDATNGFGVALILIDGSLNEYSVIGNTTDIGFFIDIQSGAGIIGRQVEVAVRISTLTELGGGYPNTDWKCTYIDTNSNIWNLAIATPSKTDRKLGIYLLTLEAVNGS